MYESGPSESNDGHRPSQTRTPSLVNSNSATDQANLYEVLGLENDPDHHQQPAPRTKRLSQLSIIPARKASRSAPSLPVQSSSENAPPVPRQAETPRLDAEGFTIPPEDRDRKPWESNNGTQVLDDDDDDEGRQTARNGNENENENRYIYVFFAFSSLTKPKSADISFLGGVWEVSDLMGYHHLLSNSVLLNKLMNQNQNVKQRFKKYRIRWHLLVLDPRYLVT